jgi:vesicular inhibitory amino acid transporter
MIANYGSNRSKFALATRPLNTTIDLLIGIDRPTSAEVLEKKPTKPRRRGLRNTVKRVLGVVQRVAIALLSVTVSILVPDFSTTSEPIYLSFRPSCVYTN